MTAKRGRPHKTDPKVIVCLLGLPGTNFDEILLYLKVRYHFTVVEIPKLVKKEFSEDFPKKDKDFFSILDYRRSRDPDHFVTKAWQKIKEKGRPFGAISMVIYNEELRFFRNIQLITVYVEQDFEQRSRYLSWKKHTLTKEELQKADDELMSLHKKFPKTPFSKMVEKADYVISTASLPLMYEKIEQIVRSIGKGQPELKEMVKERRREFGTLE